MLATVDFGEVIVWGVSAIIIVVLIVVGRAIDAAVARRWPSQPPPPTRFDKLQSKAVRRLDAWLDKP
jgi:hypothetical protein